VQSVVATHAILHDVAPHTYAPHDLLPALQPPDPSQVPVLVSVYPVVELNEQLALPHEIAVGYEQDVAVAPLHVAAHGPLPGHAARAAIAGLTCTAPVTVTHVPFAPATSQAWH
jgi:hypothetical protein